MIPKHYKLVADNPISFELYDERDGKRFHIPKALLDPKMHAHLSKVEKFDDGGAVTPENPDAVQPEQSEMATDPVMPERELASGATSTWDASPAAASVLPPVKAAPPSVDPMAVQNAGQDSVSAAELKALQGGAAAEGAEGDQKAKVLHDYGSKLDSMLTPQQILDSHKAQDDALMQAYQNKQIDPNRYIHSMSTGSKVAAGIGMIFGGMSAGTLGGPNIAMQNINKAIDDDIEAQKNDQSKSMTLWKMNREATHSDIEANLMTQKQMLAGVEAKMQEAAAKAQGPIARARIAPAIAEIKSKILANNYKLALMTPNGQGGGGFLSVDPVQLVPGMVPESHQKQVFTELGQAQTAVQNEKPLMDNYDAAIHENTILRTGGGLLRTPPSIKNLTALVDPLIHDNEGRINELEQKHVQALFPQPGDMSDTIASKRQALQEFIQHKKSAPTAKGFGLDPERFQSTSSNPAARLNPAQIPLYNRALERLKANSNDMQARAALNAMGIK